MPVIPLNHGTVPKAIKPSHKQHTSIENQPSVEQVDEDDDDNIGDDGGGVDDADEDIIYEDEEIEENPGQVEAKPTSTPNEPNEPVILTSNFFLPGKPLPKLPQTNDFHDKQEPNDLSSDIAEVNNRDKDNAEDVIDSRPDEQPPEKFVEQTTKRATVATTPPPKKLSSTAASVPKVKHVTEDPNVEYEYEYVDYDETTTESRSDSKPTADEPEREHEHTTVNSFDAHESTEEVPESEATIKSDIKSDNKSITSGTITSTSSNMQTSTSASTSAEQIEANESAETTPISTTETVANNVDSTESYMVATVQTSRSITGARFLTIPLFPTAEEEERRQLLGETKNEKPFKGNDDDHSDDEHHAADDTHKDDDLVKPYETEPSSTEIDGESTESSDENVPQTTAHPELTIASKTHKLSTVSEKLAHLHELNEPKPDVTTTSVPVVIRKFSPRTTKAPIRKSSTATSKKPTTSDADVNLASLLPPGFKYRANSIKETTILASSTTPRSASAAKPIETVAKDAAIKIGDKLIQFKEIAIDALLPKDYKPADGTADNSKINVANLTQTSNEPSNIESNDGGAATGLSKTTKAPFHLSTVTENISKFLPPGFKLPKESSTTKRPIFKTTMDDISKFLPPGFKLPKSTTTEMPTAPKASENGNDSIEQSVLNKLSFNVDISSLLPTGFKANATPADSAQEERRVDTHENAPSNSTTSNSSFKLVFPKGIGKRPVRLTTARPLHAGGPAPPEITIRKGLPTR